MNEVAFIGNPNCGKSTLFNLLTGARQRVGNWPGVTVEKTSGTLNLNSAEDVELIDLPGLYSLQGDTQAEDEQIVRNYLQDANPTCIVNIVDATALDRSLYLTTQLTDLCLPLIVVLNKCDVAEKLDINVNPEDLSKQLNCPVLPIVAKKRVGIEQLEAAIEDSTQAHKNSTVEHPTYDQLNRTPEERYQLVDNIVKLVKTDKLNESKVTQAIDRIVLNKYLAYPIFLLVMYLMFMFTINIGSAFIDFFDIAGNALFVDGFRLVLEQVQFPGWLVALLAEGVGGGIQLVGTFIPVIACLFLFLSILEDTGYMGRVAFILDRLMQRLGLPGKSFVALIVGFGCNVPSVMATRTLDNKPDRVLATIMAPFMSCGARLTVYALFATAFFPSNGQNIVFLLYILGIVVAVGSAWVLRNHLVPTGTSSFTLELPRYHLPTLRNVLTTTWHRLSGFVRRAGKAIVCVVVILNFVNSLGTDGSFGNDNTEKSALSVIGKTITPIFHPMGIDEDNWPATVGIFTGMFAKEVVVGTLDALYSPANTSSDEFSFTSEIVAAGQSIPANLASIGDALGDPLGIGIGDVSDLDVASSEQEVELNTVRAMQSLFHGQLGAISYLVFILLYMPCVATIGAIYKEIGGFWAAFSTVWSVVIAYSLAVVCYQIGMLSTDPVSSLLWITGVILATVACFAVLIQWSKSHPAVSQLLIPIRTID